MLSELLERFGQKRLIALGAIGLGLIMFFGYIIIRANQPDMGLLYKHLDQSDAGRILDKLQTLNVSHDVKGDGTQIYVPSDQIARLRMELAQDGMPTAGNIGYEIFDKQDIFGTTNALLNINQLRALEGELAKSISTIEHIAGARVHLVIPKRELFSETKTEPSASVMVRLRGTSSLSAMQVQAIRYMVASAVPELLLDQVSIVDDRGNLLARGKESVGNAKDGLTVHQDLQHEYEQRLARSVESLLDRTLGVNKSRVEISVEMDFDQLSSTSIHYDPDGQVVRSQTLNEEGENSRENGATTNDGVSIQNSLPSGQEVQNAPTQTKNQTTNSEENTNYEISNITKNYVKEVGAIKRISIAVMVDGVYKKNKNGINEYQPRSEEELTKLKELVKTAVGFQEKRGDALSLVNLKFSELPQDILPIEQEESFIKDNLNKFLELGITALIVLIGLLTIVRPIVNGLFKTTTLVTQGVADNQNFNVIHTSEEITSLKKESIEEPEQSEINIEDLKKRGDQSALKKITEIIDKYPDEAVSIIRTWIQL